MIRLYWLLLFFGNDGTLPPFPQVEPGDPVPQKLYQYTGKGAITYDGVDRIRDFAAWKAALIARKSTVLNLETAVTR